MDVGSDKNVDAEVARGFGKEWSTFRQRRVEPCPHATRQQFSKIIFTSFHGICCRPAAALAPTSAVVPDAGRRWSRPVSPICISSMSVLTQWPSRAKI